LAPKFSKNKKTLEVISMNLVNQENKSDNLFKGKRIKIDERLLNKIKELYSNDNTLENIRKILSEKYGVTVCQEAVRKRLLKSGIKMRTREEFTKLFLVKILPENQINEIIEMYTKRKNSIKKIERTLKINRRIISRVLRENKVAIIEKEKAMLLANTKHRKIPFSGNENEKAYIVGLVEGDLHARKKSKYTLRLTTGTTHRDFLELIKSIFAKYGPVYCYPVKQKEEYRWNISVEIDLNSFSYLLKRKEYLNKVCRDSFIYLMAGLIDSDGSIIVRKTEKYFQYVIRFFSQNRTLLGGIKNKLQMLGYSPHIYINSKKGKIKVSKHSIMVSNKDDLCLELSCKREVVKLLRILPINHPEKIQWKNIIFNLEDEKQIYHKDIKRLLEKARGGIQLDVKQFIDEAKEKYNLKKKLITIP